MVWSGRWRNTCSLCVPAGTLSPSKRGGVPCVWRVCPVQLAHSATAVKQSFECLDTTNTRVTEVRRWRSLGMTVGERRKQIAGALLVVRLMWCERGGDV